MTWFYHQAVSWGMSLSESSFCFCQSLRALRGQPMGGWRTGKGPEESGVNRLVQRPPRVSRKCRPLSRLGSWLVLTHWPLLAEEQEEEEGYRSFGKNVTTQTENPKTPKPDGFGVVGFGAPPLR